jgi:cysteine desulfurase
MILTAQEEYGLRCALTLARAQQYAWRLGSDGSLTLGQIAATEGLTSPYAGKLLRLLVHSGLVESTRGRSGGYTLSVAASEISIARLLQALGNKMYDGDICSSNPAPGGLCVHNSDCAVRSLWTGLQQLIDGYLTRTSLADLMGDESSATKTVAHLLPLDSRH